MFVLVGDGQHGEEAGGTVQQDGLNYAFVKQQQKVGGLYGVFAGIVYGYK